LSQIASSDDGLAFVCKMCTNWLEVADKGASNCAIFHSGGTCFGPFKGGCFPEYKGPLQGAMHVFCFICGGKAAGVIPIGGKYIGICQSHIDTILANAERVEVKEQ